MELIYLILPLALVIAAGFVAAFVWAARDDQFEDLDTPAIRMLHEDPPLPSPDERGKPETPESVATTRSPTPRRRDRSPTPTGS